MYIVWSNAELRYPELAKLPDVSSASQVEYIALAEGYINSRLSSRYTVPFAATNITAQDLSIDALYIQTQMTRQPEKAKALKEFLDERIAALLSGNASMVDSAGAISGTLTREPVWSNTMDYSPTFGMGDPLSWDVSSSQIDDEEDARAL